MANQAIHIETRSRHGLLSAKDMAATRFMLVALGQMFKFYRALDVGTHRGVASVFHGRLIRCPRNNGIFKHHVARIRYNEGEYQDICQAFRKVQMLGDDGHAIFELQRLYFGWAILLVSRAGTCGRRVRGQLPEALLPRYRRRG